MEETDRRRALEEGAATGLRVLIPSEDGETAAGVYWVDLYARHPIGSRLKRLMDIAFSIVFIALSAPFMVLTVLFIRIVSRGPAIYVQRRIGFRCTEFDMYKFRTMIPGADRHEAQLKQSDDAFLKVRNDPRITWWGRFLRRYSIDELPQLFNVLAGSMSLVGPRPLLLSDLGNFPLRNQMRRFSVSPGLTGLWQVSGRSATSEADRLELDKKYVNEWSLWLDLKILVRTVRAVFSARGAV